MNGNVARQPAVEGKGLKPYTAPTLNKGPILSAIAALPAPVSGKT